MSNRKKLIWKTVPVRLGDIVANPNNPKYSDDQTVERLNDSIETLGEFQDLVLEYDQRTAVDGHQRLNAWLESKGADYIVNCKAPNRKLTKEERDKIILYSGKGTHGTFDFDMLEEHFEVDDLVNFGGFERSLFADVESSEEGPEEFSHAGKVALDHKCPKCGFEFDD